MNTQLEILNQIDIESIYSFAVIGFVVGAAIIIIDWRRKIKNQNF